MDGIILLNKTKNVTSRDCVNEIIKIFNTKKVGHTGTLDPIAEGLLIITIGKYTKLNDALTQEYKEYIAEFLIGKSTDTFDITGKVLKEEDNINIRDNEIVGAINSFKGTYMQEVPIYSAVKVNGRKLYDYARNNEKVNLPKKIVTIKEIEVLSIIDNIVKFKCLVSKGTYIRSLIRDIGNKLNVPTVMTSLLRTKQGKFNIEDSYTIEDIKNNNYTILDIEDVLDLQIVECSDSLYHKVSSGCKIDLDNYEKDYVLFKYNNKKIAIYHREDFYRMFLKLEN